MRKTVNWVAVVVLALQASAAGAETFADALAGAYKTSNLLAQQQAVLRATDEKAAQALARLRPVVQYAIQAGSNGQQAFVNGDQVAAFDQAQSASLQLTASMLLYDFGASRTGVAAAKETILAVEEQLRGVEQQILLGAAQAYINVTLQEKMVEMQQSNVELVTKDLAAAKDKFEVGEVTMTDVSQVEAQLAVAQSQLVSAQGQLTLAREQYKAAVGRYPTSLAALPKAPALPKSVGEAQAIAAKTSPQILAAQHQSLSADLAAEQTRLGMQPQISASVTASTTNYFNDSVNFASGTMPQQLFGQIQMGQTIYQGGALSSQYRAALNQQDAAKAGLAQAAVEVSQNVGIAWSNLQVASASIAASDQQVKAAQAALDGVRQEFAVGSRTTLDVLNAQQAVLNAESARLQSYAALYSGQYALLSAMGLMTAEYLKLGVPIYDPKAYFNAVQNAPATSPQSKKLDQIMKLMGRD